MSTSMRVGVAGAILCGAVAAHAQQAGAPRTLTMQASWPASSTFMENFNQFADRVNKTTAGRLQIKTSAAGTIVPAFEVTDATHRGVLDGAHTWSGYLIGKHPAAVLFTGGPGGPFGMDLFDHLGWFYDGGGQQLMDEWFETIIKRDVISLPILPFTPQMFGWFKQPFKGWADLKGRKLRAVGMNALILNAAGASVVSMPGGEIVPAAQRGVIDCAEWVGGVEDLRLGLPGVFKYHYTPGMHENNSVGELGFNLDVWKSFTPAQQDAVNSAVKDTFITWLTKWQKDNADAIEEMVKKHGVQIRRTPPDILLASLKAWDEVAAENSAKSPTFKKVYESQREYAAKVVPAKRFMFPPYSFAANYYFPEKPAAKSEAKKK